MQISFLGAVQNVTGSRHLLEANGSRILIDCGLYQERQFAERNWDKFPVEPSSIDAVLLTHAHLDHCGWLPKLAKDGFGGPIYAIDATAELAQIVLMDSAYLQEEDAKFKLKRHAREKRKSPHPVAPLYTQEDVEACCPQFKKLDYEKTVEVAKGIRATFYNAGHILGSSMIMVEISEGAEKRKVLFSGDVGRLNRPILEDPTRFSDTDYVLCESTYGNRVHEDHVSIKDALAKAINDTVEAGGNVIIPSFAIERSQELLYYLNELLMEKKIPRLPTFLDSPMAVKATEVFKKHPEMYDAEMVDHMNNHHSPFDYPGLSMSRTSDESKAIKELNGSAIIIAGSGMCTGGRIKHHLVNNISDAKNTVLFVGYQAIGTLGRRIVEGEKEIRIHGEIRKVKARVVKIQGFSGHADRDELIGWLKGLKKAPRKVFVVHGESDGSKDFARYLHEQTGWSVEVPQFGQKEKLR